MFRPTRYWLFLCVPILVFVASRAVSQDLERRLYHIRADELDAPFATPSAANAPFYRPGINNEMLVAPDGFEVERWSGSFLGLRQAIRQTLPARL